MSTITSVLRRAANRLIDVAVDLGQDEEGGGELPEALLGQVAERYTMARERETHLAQTNGAAVAPISANADIFSVDDVLF